MLCGAAVDAQDFGYLWPLGAGSRRGPRPGEAFVVTAASTFPQVKFILWKEIARAHKKGRLPGRTNQTEWWIEGEIVAYGRKPDDLDMGGLSGHPR